MKDHFLIEFYFEMFGFRHFACNDIFNTIMIKIFTLQEILR